MLITELKPRETITSLAEGKKVFIINCQGCKEVYFPEKEAAALQKELADAGNVTGIMTTMMIQDIFFPESPSSSVNITSTVPMMSRTTIMYPISETIPIADTVSVSYQSGNQRGRSAGNHLHLDIVAGRMPA